MPSPGSTRHCPALRHPPRNQSASQAVADHLLLLVTEQRVGHWGQVCEGIKAPVIQQVVCGTPDGILLGSTGPDRCQALIRLKSTSVVQEALSKACMFATHVTACCTCLPWGHMLTAMLQGLTSSSCWCENQKRWAMQAAGALPRPAVQCTYTRPGRCCRACCVVLAA